MQTAEFAVAQGIDHKSVFNWCVKHVLKKRDRIIASIRKLETRYLKKGHKFGIELPMTIEQALALGAKIGNTLWVAEISKEMENVRVAFEVLPDGKAASIGHQFVQCHMLFDMKMEDFRQKARFVAGGHMTEALATVTYASIVSRETVRIAFMIATVNNLEIKLGNILNAYVQAPVTEKVWTTLGPEFGKDAGKTAVLFESYMA